MFKGNDKNTRMRYYSPSSDFIVNFDKFSFCSNALPADVKHILQAKPGTFTGAFVLGRTPRKKKRKEPYERGALGFLLSFLSSFFSQSKNLQAFFIQAFQHFPVQSRQYKH